MIIFGGIFNLKQINMKNDFINKIENLKDYTDKELIMREDVFRVEYLKSEEIIKRFGHLLTEEQLSLLNKKYE